MENYGENCLRSDINIIVSFEMIIIVLDCEYSSTQLKLFYCLWIEAVSLI